MEILRAEYDDTDLESMKEFDKEVSDNTPINNEGITLTVQKIDQL